MSQFRPLLCETVKDIYKLRYPLFGSVKLDGTRAHWFGKEFLSRRLKTIPNREVQAIFNRLPLPTGSDGELIWGDPTAPGVRRKTSSILRTKEASGAEIRFFVFDNFEAKGGFSERIAQVYDIEDKVIKLDQILIDNPEELLLFKDKCLNQGYEGVCLRQPDGKYKYGRSTLTEQYLLRIKPFSDANATIIGFEELLHNANEASFDERGYTKRSSHKENKIPMGCLGSFVCSLGSVIFNVGTGFTDKDRITFWRIRNNLLGKKINFKYQTSGGKSIAEGGTGMGPPYVFLDFVDEFNL